MALVLHYAPGSTATIPQTVMEEAGMSYRLRLFDPLTETNRTLGDTGLRLSGRIPALEDDTLVIFETGAIIQHLLLRTDASFLMPPVGSKEHSRFLQWLFYLITTPHRTVLEILRPESWVRDLNARAQFRNAAFSRLAAQCDFLDANVSDGTFMSYGYTVLDIYLTELARWIADTDLPVTRWRRLARIVDQSRARPAYQRVLSSQDVTWPGSAAKDKGLTERILQRWL